MNAPLKPVCALLIHGADSNGYGHTPVVVTTHSISHDGNGSPILDAGRILGVADVANLKALLHDPSDATRQVRLYPYGVLSAERDFLAWHRPARMTVQYWRTPDGVVKLHAILPALIFAATAHGLFVAALGDDQFPDDRSALFHAPLGNVYEHSGVCTGSAVMPRSLSPDDIPAWERVLLASNYTHVNHGHTLAGGATTTTLLAFWQKRQRYKSAPRASLLMPMERDVMSWLSAIRRVGDPASR